MKIGNDEGVKKEEKRSGNAKYEVKRKRVRVRERDRKEEKKLCMYFT